jgi:hypothetical protein
MCVILNVFINYIFHVSVTQLTNNNNNTHQDDTNIINSPTRTHVSENAAYRPTNAHIRRGNVSSNLLQQQHQAPLPPPRQPGIKCLIRFCDNNGTEIKTMGFTVPRFVYLFVILI